MLESDEYIDKICSNLTDKDTLEIENTDEFRYNLWKSLINTDEYINFLNQRRILESGVSDKKYNREYRANDGEHFLSLLSALEDANFDKSKYDDYIKENLYIYGKNVYNENYDSTNILKEIKLSSKENRIKPIDKKKLVNDYQENYWIKK